MTCNHFEKKLEAYVLGVLSDKERMQLEKHLNDCTLCKQALIKHQKASMLLEKAFDMDAPEYLKTKVLANAKDVKTKSTHWLRWAVPSVAGVIALVLIVQIQPGRMVKQNMQATHLEEQFEADQELVSKDMPLKPGTAKRFGSVKVSGPIPESSEVPIAEEALPVSAAPPAESAFAPEMEAAPRLDKMELAKSGKKSKSIAKLSAPRKKSKKKSYAGAGKSKDLMEMKLGAVASRQAGQGQTTSIAGGGMKADADDLMEMEQQFASVQEAKPAAQPATASKGKAEGYLSQQARSSTTGAARGAAVSYKSEAKPKRERVKRKRAAAVASAPMKSIREPEPVALSMAEPVDREEEKEVTVQVGLESGAKNLDQAHVLRVLEQLERQLKARLSQKKPKGFYTLEVAIQSNGKVNQVQFIGKSFDTVNLNQDIIANIKSLRFGPSGDQQPASITIHIQLK